MNCRLPLVVVCSIRAGPLLVVRFNPKVKHRVKLDVGLIETEQCQTPLLPQGVVGYIDGVRFDPWGTPIFYDILPRPRVPSPQHLRTTRLS